MTQQGKKQRECYKYDTDKIQWDHSAELGIVALGISQSRADELNNLLMQWNQEEAKSSKVIRRICREIKDPAEMLHLVQQVGRLVQYTIMLQQETQQSRIVVPGPGTPQ